MQNKILITGDPSSLVSNNTKIRTRMKWIPKYDNLELICKSAFEWEQGLNSLNAKQ